MIKITAEIGINHNGNFDTAIEMIRVAKECGAHIAKFQHYCVDILCVNRNDFSNYDVLKKLCPKPSWMPLLKLACDRAGIEFMCTSFCKYSAEDIAPFVKSFKVGSFEAHNIPFIQKLASYNKPLIVSTGKADLRTLDRIFEITNNVSLLYCVSKYPATYDDYYLGTIDELRNRYNCPVGLSDHTQGIELAKMAAEKGVFMIEKHFKISDDCIDSNVSINPVQLAELTRVTRVLDNLR